MAIVLFLVFLAMAAIVSIIQELVGQVMQARSRTLRGCLKDMLTDDTYGEKIYRRFFDHPRIVTPGRQVSHLSWIKPEDFAIALATAVQPQDSHDDSITSIGASILALREGKLKRRMRLALPDVFREGVSAEEIKTALGQWFDAQMLKATEHFKRATRMRLYVIAAATAVVFNVNPIKIAQYLQAQPQLTQAFAAAAPELARLVNDTNQNALASLGGADGSRSQNALMAPGGDELSKLTLADGSQAEGLSAKDAKTLLFLYQCKRNLIVLPIGWPWMGALIDRIDAHAPKPTSANPVEQQALDSGADPQAVACAAALSNTDLSPAARQRLSMLGMPSLAASAPSPSPSAAPASPFSAPAVAPAPNAKPSTAASPAPGVGASPTPPASPAPAATPSPEIKPAAVATPVGVVDPKALQASVKTFERRFGPNFASDPWYTVLLGWIIMTLGAAQGAPFWFDLLKKLLQTRV